MNEFTHLADTWAPRSILRRRQPPPGTDPIATEWMAMVLWELNSFPDARDAVLRRAYQLAGMPEQPPVEPGRAVSARARAAAVPAWLARFVFAALRSKPLSRAVAVGQPVPGFLQGLPCATPG